MEALESLYRADLPRFVRAATAIVGDEGAGRDAVQDAFVLAVRKRTGYKDEAPRLRILELDVCRLRVRAPGSTPPPPR